MKNMLAIICMVGVFQTLQAQKLIEKHFAYSGKDLVSMNIQIADSIKIITWNKNEVYVKASVDVNDNKNNDDYKFSFDESGTTIAVKSKFEFEKGKNCCGGSGNWNCNCETKITCEVFIPENAAFSVETINGNISISGKTAQVRAHTISGFIDLAIAADTKADLKMNTISGTMYTNFDLQSDKGIRHVGGSSIRTMLNGGGDKSIDLETISGDIFFRKQS